MPRKTLVTAKSLGLTPDTKLSTSFSNSKRCFKTVSDVVLGYHIIGDGQRSHVRIAPVYRADVWIREGKHTLIIHSHEVGEYFNPPRSADALPDYDGDSLAFIAGTAMGALERHAVREENKPPRWNPRSRRG